MKYDFAQMVADADHTIDFIFNIMNKDPDARIWLEVKVELPLITNMVWGTADIVIYLPQCDELWVLDYKYGRVEVRSADNEQLMLYLMGVIQTLMRGKALPKTMNVGIIQPRGRDILDITSVTAADIFDKFLPRLKRALVAINPDYYKRLQFDIEHSADWVVDGVPKAEFVVSEETCTWCPALAQCETARKAAFDACQFEPVTVGRQDFESFLPMIPVMKRWCEQMESAALCYLENGGEIEGYEIGEGRTHRKWTDEDAAKEFLRGLGLPLKTIAPPVLLSPAKMEKVLKTCPKKIASQQIDMYIYKPEGKNRLQKSR